MAQWPKIIIQTKTGAQNAIAPLVVSASRATDIPAFHVDWLMNRLKAGYCLWQNPFNPSQRQYVSFHRCASLVFWSKNPANILPHLAEIQDMGLKFYFQFTLNDYVSEGLEPRLPSLDDRVATFAELSRRIGRQFVIWRFDPILLGPNMDAARIIGKIENLARRLCQHTSSLVFSFVDFYRKTKINLGKVDPACRPPDNAEILRLAEDLANMNARLENPLEIMACAEKLDLSQYGIGRASCIDAGLLARLCPQKPEFGAACEKVASERQLLPDLPSEFSGKQPKARLRDSGQRKLCACFPSKDIGRYDTCGHGCLYCYANSTPRAGELGRQACDPFSERL